MIAVNSDSHQNHVEKIPGKAIRMNFNIIFGKIGNFIVIKHVYTTGLTPMRDVLISIDNTDEK